MYINKNVCVYISFFFPTFSFIYLKYTHRIKCICKHNKPQQSQIPEQNAFKSSRKIRKFFFFLKVLSRWNLQKPDLSPKPKQNNGEDHSFYDILAGVARTQQKLTQIQKKQAIFCQIHFLLPPLLGLGSEGGMVEGWERVGGRGREV